MRFSLDCANAFVCAIDGIRYVCRYLNDASDVISPNNVLLMPAYANPNEYCTVLHWSIHTIDSEIPLLFFGSIQLKLAMRCDHCCLLTIHNYNDFFVMVCATLFFTWKISSMIWKSVLLQLHLNQFISTYQLKG